MENTEHAKRGPQVCAARDDRSETLLTPENPTLYLLILLQSLVMWEANKPQSLSAWHVSD